MRTSIVLVLGLAAGVLGYGWWHVATHATFTMSLNEKTADGKFGQVFNAELAFLDASGNMLAKGRTDGKFGVVLIAHPTEGYCGPDLKQEDYSVCFKTQSTWLTAWAPNLRYVDLVAGQCRLQRVPVKVSVYKDNVFLWWVPLPHVGGAPYTMYSTQLEIDSRACTVTGYRG